MVHELHVFVGEVFDRETAFFSLCKKNIFFRPRFDEEKISCIWLYNMINNDTSAALYPICHASPETGNLTTSDPMKHLDTC